MLLITFHNDSTGTTEIGNYDVVTKVNYTTIWTGRLEEVPRGDWRDMIIELAYQLQLEQHKENTQCTD
jgi:hypothetical protein